MRPELPSGTVTFLFTDVEGSTRLLGELGAEGYGAALAEHRGRIRAARTDHGGVEVDTQGDAFFVAFPTAPGALAAAAAMTEALAQGPIRVRIGIHTGTPLLTAEGYVGGDVHRAARIAGAGHGGQVLVSAATAALVGVDGLRDLGEHRFKDLAAPERVYQLGVEDFPALKSLYHTNLPVPVTSFLGRERELDEVVGLIGRENVRVVTLTGPGGTGKTRLSMQAAASLGERYADGIYWVPLAALRDPQLVLSTVGHVLGSRNGLAEHIGDRSMLLVLDNFEQVIAAATDLAPVVAACPRLDVLVTSREALRIAAEHEYPVPTLAHVEAVELFTSRARAFRPEFVADDSVAEICRRLDELPLAIELAAARVTVLSPAQILARLDQRLPLLTSGARDLPERQRTLRGAIAWSHELLTLDEQGLFARLAVFRGGCTLEAAEEVSGADLDGLASLVDKSLLRQRDGRYWMLETIREYAVERLEASGEAGDLQQAHGAHYLALAEAAFPHLKGDPKAWLDRLELEHDNLRAAFDRLESAGEAQLTLQLAGALWKFWYMRGYLVEGRRRLERALAADARPTPVRARALSGATGHLVDEDPARARAFGEEGLDLYRTLGDDAGVANSLFLLGSAANEVADFSGAVPFLEESLGAFEALGDDHYVLLSRFHLAWAYGELGDPERALALEEENLRRARVTGNVRMEAMSLDSVAGYALDHGRAREGLELLQAAMAIYRDLGERVKVADSLSRIARALALLGRGTLAACLMASSVARFAEVGSGVPLYVARRNEEIRAALREHLDDRAFDAASEAGRVMATEAAVALAVAPLDEIPDQSGPAPGTLRELGP